MTRKKYEKYALWFFRHRFALKWFRRISLLLPLFFGAVYIFVLITLATTVYNSSDEENNLKYLQYLGTLIKISVIPMVVFISVTVLRKVSDSPRPYEMYKIRPLIKAKKRGESFPSRHVASAVIISMVLLSINTFFGCLFLLLSFLLAVMRVVSGVHFPKDVVASFIIGILAGMFLFF